MTLGSVSLEPLRIDATEQKSNKDAGIPKGLSWRDRAVGNAAFESRQRPRAKKARSRLAGRRQATNEGLDRTI